MRVSIVTPSFNQGRFVERTLVSVIDQDHPDLEYIVIDGGSCDGTTATLERYRHRVTHLVIEPDDGQADAIRKGFAMASGEILGYLNSDDVLLPGTVAFVSDFFARNPHIDAVYSNRIHIDEDDRITNLWVLPAHCNYCMSRWDFIPQETCFWRRSLMEQVGSVDPSFQFALDYDLFVRMMGKGRFKRVNRFLAAFRLHADSKSTMLYDTVGRPEIAKVQQANGIRMHWFDHALKYAFGGAILGVSFILKVFAINVIRRRISL